MKKEDIKKGNPDLLDLSPLKAIRAKCLDCGCESYNEVKQCQCDGVHSALCPLYQYRLGHNPNRSARVYTEEERKAIAERFSKYRNNGKNPNDYSDDFEEFDESEESISSDNGIDITLDSDNGSKVYEEEEL